MQTAEWENFYIVCSWTEFNELITIVVEYLIVSKLGSILLLLYELIIKCMSARTQRIACGFTKQHAWNLSPTVKLACSNIPPHTCVHSKQDD